jgi:hypothetical protein
VGGVGVGVSISGSISGWRERCRPIASLTVRVYSAGRFLKAKVAVVYSSVNWRPQEHSALFGLGLGFFPNFDPKSHPISLFVQYLLLMMVGLEIARLSLRETPAKWKLGLLAAFLAGANFQL